MGVSEQHLDGAQIRPGIEQMSRESVPEGVGRHAAAGQHLCPPAGAG
jgi:hypothetical protein